MSMPLLWPDTFTKFYNSTARPAPCCCQRCFDPHFQGLLLLVRFQANQRLASCTNFGWQTIRYITMVHEASAKSRFFSVKNDRTTLGQWSNGPHMSIEVCETVSACFPPLAGNFLNKILDKNEKRIQTTMRSSQGKWYTLNDSQANKSLSPKPLRGWGCEIE